MGSPRFQLTVVFERVQLLDMIQGKPHPPGTHIDGEKAVIRAHFEEDSALTNALTRWQANFRDVLGWHGSPHRIEQTTSDDRCCIKLKIS